jgi:hypothetical protein
VASALRQVRRAQVPLRGVIAGTVFENTNVPLRHWFRVIHLLLTSKKGVAAFEVQRMLGFRSCRPAWYMCHRVRAALADEGFLKLMCIVEIDESINGGKPKNRRGHFLPAARSPSQEVLRLRYG